MNNCRAIILFCCAALICCCHSNFEKIKHDCLFAGRLPLIKPDYTGITIPPNIAPLNFALKDSSSACVAEIASVNGAPIVVWGKKRDLLINSAPWKRLLAENIGNPLHITIYSKNNSGSWQRYTTIEDTIANETVDRYCTYRLLNFQYNYSNDLRECQRDLTSFNETVLLNSQNYQWGCVNCHMPMNNTPDRFVLQVRSKTYGSETLIASGDTLATIKSRLGYTAWHPGGKYIAFSVYKVQQYFHAVGRQFIDVYDKNSCIVLYNVAEHRIVSAPQLNQQGMLETWPVWSPDGRYLYFCSAPVLWSDSSKDPPDNFNKTQYSLMRIEFDSVNSTFGAIDTVLSPKETGLSISQPRLSPDNRFCLFCMQTFGAYPHTQASSDLYLMDVATRKYSKLPINSDYNESWHSWSKNSRWIIFSSKRGGGIFTRLYFSYIDSTGNAHKPFILPQRDPAFYDSFIKCYNVQEFATSPVRFSERQMLKAVRTKHSFSVPVPSNTTKNSYEQSSTPWSSADNHQ